MKKISKNQEECIKKLGFVDWNLFSKDELASFLEKNYSKRDNQESDSILKLVDYYKNSKNESYSYDINEMDRISKELLDKYRWHSTGLAYSICRMVDYYQENSKK